MKVVRGISAAVMLLAGVLWVVNTPDDLWTGSTELTDGIYDPVRAGEQTPGGFRQLLPRDAIFPVYSPVFRSAESTEWQAETLVIGVEVNGEAKAYPVNFLNRREMVNDWIGGSPVLVTW